MWKSIEILLWTDYKWKVNSLLRVRIIISEGRTFRVTTIMEQGIARRSFMYSLVHILHAIFTDSF
jgi:hypothetical protein